MTLAEINAFAEEDFVQRFADVAEHSRWVAERAALSRPFQDRDMLVDAFQRAVASGTRAEQNALISAHPDLAGRAKLLPDSAREQKGAGLDSLTAPEFARFTDLNRRYRDRFGFPFIFAVRGAGKDEILQAFERRVDGGRVEEFWTALSQVMRIIRFRIEERVDG